MRDVDPLSFDFTQRLAELLARADGATALAYLQQLGARERDAARAPAARGSLEVVGASGSRAGIWEAATDGGFERAPGRVSEWRRWADVARIPPKGERRRVVLVGESAARGYFYDPALTPASLLERMLAAVPGLPQVEVVDLARTDLTLPGMVTLLLEAVSLKPDLFLLWAGNNWPGIDLSPAEALHIAGVLRRDGYVAARRAVLETITVPRCRAALDLLAQLAQALAVPVVVIVPEFNLGRWRSELPPTVAPLPGDQNVAWTALRDAAQAALAAGDASTARHLAEEMTRLDGGTSALSFTLLADALARTGEREAERRAREAARDAPCASFIPHAPRCPTVLQNLLRADGAARGMALVDLPEIFDQHLQGELPDERLFLDYCHLNLTGMRLGMAATATRIAALLAPGTGLPPEVAAIPSGLAAEAEAVTHVLAAIHNAHYGQSREVIAHHCARALALSPRATELMLLYLDLQRSAGPDWLCRSYEELHRIPVVARYLWSDDPRATAKLADHALTEVFAESLIAAGVDPRGLSSLARTAPAPSRRSVDLLDPARFARTFRERNGCSFAPERAYLRAYETASAFWFEAQAGDPVRLDLTLRVPAADPAADEVTVLLNGRLAKRFPATRTWQTLAVEPHGLLRDGTNQVELRWPVRYLPAQHELEGAARQLERGTLPDVLPVFGEIQRFVTRIAPERERTDGVD